MLFGNPLWLTRIYRGVNDSDDNQGQVRAQPRGKVHQRDPVQCRDLVQQPCGQAQQPHGQVRRGVPANIIAKRCLVYALDWNKSGGTIKANDPSFDSDISHADSAVLEATESAQLKIGEEMLILGKASCHPNQGQRDQELKEPSKSGSKSFKIYTLGKSIVALVMLSKLKLSSMDGFYTMECL